MKVEIEAHFLCFFELTVSCAVLTLLLRIGIGIGPCGEGIQADELIKWLTWIDSWATSTASREEEIQGHDKRQFDEAYAFPAHPCLAGLLICLGGVVRLGGQFNRIYSIIMNP